MRGGIPHRGGRGGGKLILGYQHKVVAPSSTEEIIIFPVDRVKGQFNMNFYNPAMTRGKISREEITKFLQEAGPIVKPIFKTQMISFLKGYQAVYSYSTIGIIICCGIPIVAGVYLGKFQIVFVAAAIFALFWLTLAIVSIINCYHIADVKRKIEESKGKVTPLVIARNSEFKRKGYFWVSPHNFPYWLELWVSEAPQVVSMERHDEIPMREETPCHNPSNSTQISLMMSSP